MANKTRVQFTANFEANLLSIEAYWEEIKFPDGFDRLLSELTEKTLPNLERFPAMGKLFLIGNPARLKQYWHCKPFSQSCVA